MRLITILVLSAAAPRAFAGVIPASLIPADIMGVGSQFTLTKPIEFAGGRTKWFCDGAERTTLFAWAGRCCMLHPNLRAHQITLRAGVPRTVNYINRRRSMAMIDAGSETFVRCRSHIISATYLKKAFGDLIQIDRVTPPLKVTPGQPVEL